MLAKIVYKPKICHFLIYSNGRINTIQIISINMTCFAHVQLKASLKMVDHQKTNLTQSYW